MRSICTLDSHHHMVYNEYINQRGSMITISREFNKELTETIEDMVEYTISEAAKRGELVSGETAWKMISCLAAAKEAEFAGII